MCYSQQVNQDFQRLMRTFGAKLSTKEFLALYKRRQGGERVLIPKGMDEAFLASADPSLGEIRDLICEHLASESTRLEELLFAQRTRLVDAERKLAVKFTKGATESKRIAGDKIEEAKIKLADLVQATPSSRNAPMSSGCLPRASALERVANAC